jgi:RNA polymerase sigma-70 factor (sigma-E family)
VRSSHGFEGLDALVAEHGRALLATATLLTGSRDAGEDLLQAALERLLRHWHGVRGERVIYLRRTLYHLAVDSWRARRRRPRTVEVSEPAIAAISAGPDAVNILELRHSLMQALAQLPPRQRAVLVLRYWEQLSEAETVEVLGCSIGTVKSTSSRGLARLREVSRSWTTQSALIMNGDHT